MKFSLSNSFTFFREKADSAVDRTTVEEGSHNSDDEGNRIDRKICEENEYDTDKTASDVWDFTANRLRAYKLNYNKIKHLIPVKE